MQETDDMVFIAVGLFLTLSFVASQQLVYQVLQRGIAMY